MELFALSTATGSGQSTVAVPRFIEVGALMLEGQVMVGGVRSPTKTLNEQDAELLEVS
jgi:hypothetical protein